MLKRGLFEGLTEKFKGLIKLPSEVVIWLTILQEKIWNRWGKRDELLRFCNWSDRLTKKNFDINPRVLLSIPNLLSLFRLTIIPFYLFGYVIGVSKWFYLFVYLTLMILDLFDGPIARQTGTTSSLGKAIDPLGDKVCHTSMALVVVLFGFAPWWLFVALLIKEVLLTIISYHHTGSGAKIYGKIGTVIEVVVLSLAFIVMLPNWVFVALTIIHWVIFLAYRLAFAE